MEMELITPATETSPPNFSVNTGAIQGMGEKDTITKTCLTSSENGSRKKETRAKAVAQVNRSPTLVRTRLIFL